MTALIREARLLFAARTAIVAALLLCALAAAGVALGVAQVRAERASIARVLALSAEDRHAVTAFAKDAGSAAYYTFHPTWDPPSDLAFAALGGRDVAPAVLRIRALALEGQLYDAETANPELALPGRFDFAFVAVYLAPLVLIALLHDLWSGEAEAGRLAALQAQPRARWRIWWPRIAVRVGVVLTALLVPFAVGGLVEGTALPRALAFAVLVVLLALFWAVASVLVARRARASATSAATLVALWFALTLVGPGAASLVIDQAIPVPDGAVLARENREAVHDGWDLPKADTMRRFLALYPEWAGTAPVGLAFDYKWYFAFQHLGDLHVRDLSMAYRDGIARRDRAAALVGWALPPAGIQRAMLGLAGTGAAAARAQQDRVRAFHASLRAFYYGYLFTGRPFGPPDFARAPRFVPRAVGVRE